MNASIVGSRTISAMLLVLNCVNVDFGSADHADAMAGEIADFLDAGFRLLARSLARRRPQHDDVLAKDGDGLGAVRHFLVAARDRKIRLVGSQHRNAVDRARGGDQRKPDRAAVPGKAPCQCFDQVLVVAARRSHGNSQGRRPHAQKRRADGGRKQQQSGGHHQQRRAIPFPASGRSGSCTGQTV
jgi:hypothetical protein